MGKFFKNKLCIYLDQFAVINLSENQEWGDLLNLIQKGVREQKIVILYSTEHLIESSHKHFDKANAADKLLFELSSGFSIEIEVIAASKLLIAALRKRPVSTAVFSTTLS